MTIKRNALTSAAALAALTLASTATAGPNFESASGWTFGVSGHIPVFAVANDRDDGRDGFRIMTGFNPATIQFEAGAPTQFGVDVTARVQLNSHISGRSGIQNSAFGNNNGNIESRVAEIQVDGDFGSVNIGKGFGIYGSNSIGDNASGMGVGLFGPNPAAATAGRIGNGYFYANFNPRVMFTSNRNDGIQFKAGIFQPEKPGLDGDLAGQFADGRDEAAKTTTPRLEGQVDWMTRQGDTSFQVWLGGFYQKVKVNSNEFDVSGFDMTGVDLGAAVGLGNANLRGAYSQTKGTGNAVFGGHGITGGSQEETARQYYVEGTYDINRFTIGLSYGEGKDDLFDSKTELAMIFGRYRATDALTLMAEFQDFSDDAEESGDYNAFILGAQMNF